MPAATGAPAVTLEERASQLTQRAAAVEPSVTPELVKLAGELGGEMIKLEYRLKTRESTLRKLRNIHAEEPKTPIAQLELDDSLRYTMAFADEPPGHHVASIRRVLTALEAQGHEVTLLKNYWPKGDNYSGVNSILRHSSGLLWELQFHTPQSIETQQATRDQYEELREAKTPMERKRELFDEMARAWDQVPIPEGILVPQALHPRDEIRDRPRP